MNKELNMNKDEWDKTYTEQNAKAEMFGAGIAGLLMLVPVVGLLALWEPRILYAIPLLVFWILRKRKSNKK
jgi:hypothetical protein